MMSSPGNMSTPDDSIRVYKYRWVIMAIFFLYTTANYFQTLQFAIISDVVLQYYEVDFFLVDCTTLIYFLCYLVIFAPMGYIIEKTNLRTLSLIATGFTAVGAVMKLFVASPDRFYLVLISQTACAVGQCFMAVLPSVTANTWFGAEQVSMACALGLFGTQIGLALSMTIPAMTIQGSDNKDLVTDQLNTLFIYNAVACVGIFVIVLIFFRSKPPSPPSRSQADNSLSDTRMSFWTASKGFVKNKDFLLVLFTLGLGLSLSASFGIVINQIYIHYLPESVGTDLGIISFISVISGGCFGSMIFGTILDRTHRFKLVSFCVLLLYMLGLIAQVIVMEMRSRIGAYIAIPATGFFGGSIGVIVYEYIAETTYPAPEAYGATILNIDMSCTCILLVVILNSVLESVGYYMGYVIMVVCLAFATLGVYFISPELRRRNANLGMKQKEIFQRNNENIHI